MKLCSLHAKHTCVETSFVNRNTLRRDTPNVPADLTLVETTGGGLIFNIPNVVVLEVTMFEVEEVEVEEVEEVEEIEEVEELGGVFILEEIMEEEEVALSVVDVPGEEVVLVVDSGADELVDVGGADVVVVDEVVLLGALVVVVDEGG